MGRLASMGVTTKVVVTMLLVAAATTVTSLFFMGTLADFIAQARNPGNNFTAGTLSMTDVVGTVVSGANCSSETYSGTCATLFSSSTTAFRPGAAPVDNTVTITYRGTISTSKFGLYADNYSTKGGGSSALCTATDPASKINLTILQGSTSIYASTLGAFAAAHSGTSSLLDLKGGTNGSGVADVWNQNDQSVFTISVSLDSSADSTYEGCQSLADFVWYAAQ